MHPCRNTYLQRVEMPAEEHLYAIFKCFLVTLSTFVENRQMEKTLIQLLLSLSGENLSLNYILYQSAQGQTILLSCCAWPQDFTVSMCSVFCWCLQPNGQNVRVLPQAQGLREGSAPELFLPGMRKEESLPLRRYF